MCDVCRWCDDAMETVLAAVNTADMLKLHTPDFLCVPLLTALLQASPAKVWAAGGHYIWHGMILYN